MNLASVPAASHAERERLLLMARNLYRFASLLMIPALALGLWLWLGYGIKGGWLPAGRPLFRRLVERAWQAP